MVEEKCMHFYVFEVRADPGWLGQPVYERTCGNLSSALERIEILKKRNPDIIGGFVTVDSVPDKFWS